MKRIRMVKELPGAPSEIEYRLFQEQDVLRQTTNCYAYALQDYGAGYIQPLLPEHLIIKENIYLPRPGQTKGYSYKELYGAGIKPLLLEKRIRLMRQALKQDGVLFQGEKYPREVPKDKYVICCFLTQNSYHFLRQNQNGIWSSKNGTDFVSTRNYDGTIELGQNPEGYYNYQKDCPFVGYFFVPKGGLHIGVKQYLLKQNRLRQNLITSWLYSQVSSREGYPSARQMMAFRYYLINAQKLFKKQYATIDSIRQIYKGSDTLPEAKIKEKTQAAFPLIYHLDMDLFQLQQKRSENTISILSNKSAISKKRQEKLQKEFT